MTRLDRLTPLEAQIASELAAQVRARYGSRARCIKLFGSRARRDARDDSDMDVLVLIQDCSLADRGAISAEARTLADLGQTHHKARAYSAGARRNQVDGPALGFA